MGRPGSTLATSGPNSRFVDQRDEVGVVEQVAQLVGDVPVVDVDRHRARLEASEHRLDPLGPVDRVDADVLAGPHADVARGSCANRFARSSSSPERQAPVAGDERDAVGHGVGDELEQVREVELHARCTLERTGPRTIVTRHWRMGPCWMQRSAGRIRTARVARHRTTSRRTPASRRSPRAATRSTPRSPPISCSVSSRRTCAATAATCSRWCGTAPLHGYVGVGRAPRGRDDRGRARAQRRAPQPARRHADVRPARGHRARRAARLVRSARAVGEPFVRRARGAGAALRRGRVPADAARRGVLHAGRGDVTTTSASTTSASRIPKTDPGDWIRQPALAPHDPRARRRRSRRRTTRARSPTRSSPSCTATGSFMTSRRSRRPRGCVGRRRLARRRSPDLDVAELPPPTQGVTALEALRIVDGFDLPARRRRPRAPARSRR